MIRTNIFNIFKDIINSSKFGLLYKIVYSFIFIFVVIFIVHSVVLISKYNAVNHDDATLFFNGTLYNRYITNCYAGKYIGSTLSKLLVADLPELFNIHPISWIQTYGAALKGIFYCFTVFALSSCLFLYKKNLFYPIFALIFYIFIENTLKYRYQAELNTSFFLFVFQCTFYFIFWKLFVKMYINNNPNNKLLYIMAFILGTSSEFTAIASFFSLLIIFIINLIRKSITKEILFSFFSLVAGMLIYFLSPTFLWSVHNRGILTGRTLINAKYMFNEFVQGYFKTFVHDFSVYIVIIIILAILIYKYINISHKNKLIPLFMILPLGTLLFFLTLIFAGRHISGYCYVVHFDLIFQAQLSFISVIAFEIACLCDKKIIYYIILFSLSIAFCVFLLPSHKLYLNGIKNNYLYNENRYLNERIIAFYSYNKFEKIVVSKNTHPFMKFPDYTDRLYNHGYNDSDITYIENDRDVYREYLKNGGCEISKEDIINADFNKLLDKNYVLTCKD